ncbi:hypothetical protein [Cerasicoccus maritimus]|uniref:hypothetical protein n=1 Tax=Cerasicoccus maritimus TaxID=490089 RepID=UPI002852C3B4|nr:hypothetical protein [Cerasicoccus maritimus]
MSKRGFSLKRFAILLAVLVVLSAVAFVSVFWSRIQLGLKFPGRVGTAADHYFFDGSETEGFRYLTFTLGDGAEWKLVEANTHGQDSLPTWLIFMVQGPDKQTLILEERFDKGRMLDIGNSFFTHAFEPEPLEVARQTASETIPADSPYLALIQARNSEELVVAMQAMGFRRTSF